MSSPTTTNDEAQAAWDANAAWWDDYIGPEGHLFHRAVIAPATERFLEVRQGDVVLDIACGNGQFSRRLADLGARVVAFDAAETFILLVQLQPDSTYPRCPFAHRSWPPFDPFTTLPTLHHQVSTTSFGISKSLIF